jgi:DNA-directed RNA polymerase subunit RPC12/RpoP
MTDSESKIIVFDSYDTIMAANLVKTKLDAYGIPCFLTNENFGGLYPFRNELFTGVRLHIFEKDQDQVKEVLSEEHAGETETLQCPDCGSKNVILKETYQSSLGKILSTVFLSPFMEEKRIYNCHHCNREFTETNN